MSQHSLGGVWEKLRRAEEHREALEAEISAYLNPDVYAARGQLDPQGQEYVVRAHVGQDPPFLRWGLITGDAIQNIRAALDHLVWQLVIANGKKPNTGNAFPIWLTRPSTAKQRGRWQTQLRGVHSDYRARIKALQPHNRPQEAPELPLAVLAALSNTDKHRIVLPAVLAVDEKLGETLRVTPHDLKIIGLARTTYAKPLKDGTEIMSIPVEITGSDPHMEMHGHIPVQVALGEKHIPILGLAQIHEYVTQTVKAFELLLDSQ